MTDIIQCGKFTLDFKEKLGKIKFPEGFKPSALNNLKINDDRYEVHGSLHQGNVYELKIVKPLEGIKFPKPMATIYIDLDTGRYKPIVHRWFFNKRVDITYTYIEKKVPGLFEFSPGSWRVATPAALQQLYLKYGWPMTWRMSYCYLESRTKENLYPVLITVSNVYPYKDFRITEADAVKIPNWQDNELWEEVVK